jgi:hypothetical protein
VIPLAQPQLVGRVTALEEPLERSDAGGVVVDAVDSEDRDVGLRRATVPVTVQVPVGVAPGELVLTGDQR